MVCRGYLFVYCGAIMPFWTVGDADPYKERLNFLMRSSHCVPFSFALNVVKGVWTGEKTNKRCPIIPIRIISFCFFLSLLYPKKTTMSIFSTQTQFKIVPQKSTKTVSIFQPTALDLFVIVLFSLFCILPVYHTEENNGDTIWAIPTPILAQTDHETWFSATSPGKK